MNDVVTYSVAGGIARITLNRPDKLNSFNDDMHAGLAECLERAGAESSLRCVLLTGAGRGFCAGQDLNARMGDTQIDLGATLEANYNRYVRMIRDLPAPVVCGVNGVAAGAGANLAFACDLVLAASSAKFIQAFCKLGLIPDCGGTWALPRLVGHARAMGLSLLGDAVSAEQAAAWGMIWRCVDDDLFHEEVEKLVTHLASQPTRGLVLAKQAIRASISNSLDQQLDLERDFQRDAGFTKDFKEGVGAFLEKRKPEFTGE